MPPAPSILAPLFSPPPGNLAAAAALTLLRAQPASRPDRLAAGLKAVAPHLTDDQRTAWMSALTTPLRQAGIVTPRRIAAFLGQCSIESAGFRCLEEDLNYSATRLCQVWPARFPTMEAAAACAASPEKLANIVYAGRMGNGDAQTGDGWRFRGRGLIQLTGRSAYERFAVAIHQPLDEVVNHVATRSGAAESAAWFWSTNGCNGLADSWSLDILTRTINGGTLGAAERAQMSQAALRAIGN